MGEPGQKPIAFPNWGPCQSTPLDGVGLGGWSLLDRAAWGMQVRILLDPAGMMHSGTALAPTGPVPVPSYARAMVAAALSAKPLRVLMIGGGGCSVPLSMLSACPHIDMTVVEPSPAMEVVARDFFSVPPRVRFCLSTAQDFAAQSGEVYDIVLVDAFAESGLVPPELVDLASTDGLRRLMGDRGKLVWNISLRRGRAWRRAMSDLLATLSASGISVECYSRSPRASRKNVLVMHGLSGHTSAGWKRERYSPFMYSPVVRSRNSPFRWPSASL